MTNDNRQIKSFAALGHEELTVAINEWIRQSHVIPLSMTVATESGKFTAFVIYETPLEKQRHLGMR